ncbi:hypothetical protein BJY16_003110 [Actinoplanes octamycinicus]|uniref:Uncharacterized protein n=1 Tax=Actinoplanes octamycinicus TaxID=135948 RepID=A0A7W7M7D9_9ACTN|nr:hypothetical protein [Actinoplanes octamycinicus]MBB4739651.1 hypothetical protein [Actinoplanes octamycinicus]GIE54834.1 hypothetical protein Aoc01nite_02360 [Actinoplanes octamycinicus]
MGNYVSITSSPAELINVAGRIRDRGIALGDQVKKINADIVEHEGRDTFPKDKFTDGFLGPTYHKQVPGADGKEHPANQALMTSAAACGDQLRAIGEYVGKAMVNYDVQDLENAKTITKPPAGH